MQTWQMYCGDALEVLKTLPDQCVDCVVTSPPYWGLRNYGHDGQIGLEKSPAEFVSALVAVMAECRRVLKDEGTLWLNLGDSYFGGGRGGNPEESEFRKHATNAGSLVERTPVPNGYKSKDLCGIPWSVAFALRADGWYLRSEIIWHKKSCMPESVKDRPTKAHEQVFLLTKQPGYFYDQDAIREKYAESTLAQIEAGYDGEGQKDYANAGVQNPSDVKRRILHGAVAPGKGKWSNVQAVADAHGVMALTGNQVNARMGDPPNGANARTVWSLGPEPATDIEHFAVMPKTLARRCILAGCPQFICSSCGTAIQSSVVSKIRTITDERDVQVREIYRVRSVQTGPDEVLQQRLQVGGDAEANQVCPVQVVREAREPRPAQSRQELLQQGVRVKAHSSDSFYNEGIHDHHKGLQTNHEAGPSEGESIWLCDGAPASDGVDSRQDSGTFGGCSSHQRDQARQPAREFKIDDEGGSRQIKQAEAEHSNLPSLQFVTPPIARCSRCSADLTAPDAIGHGRVLDPFAGSGTTLIVALEEGRNGIGIELNPKYHELARARLANTSPLLAQEIAVNA